VFWLNENDSGVTAFVLACSNQASRMWRRLMPPAVTRLRPHEKVGIVASTGMTALVLFISLVVWVARASDVPPSPVEVVAAMPRAAAAVAAAGPRGEAKRPVPLPEPAAEEPDVVAPRTAGEPTVAPRVPTSVQRAAGPVQVEGTLGAKMVWIKAGLFQMGLSDDDLHHYASLCEDSPNPACSSERWGASRPAHIRDPAPFYVDTHEVTNAEYQECIDTRTCPKLKATQCELIGSAGDFATRRLTRKRKAAMAVRVTSGDLPAACVSRVEAATYCHWASKRLPSEAEWEFAASSGGERLFPWGPLDGRGLQPINGADQALAVVMEWDGILADSVGQHRDAYAFAASVGSFEDGRTPSGLEDISGNVAEWVSDPYEPYASDNSRRSSLREGVVRGGSWADFGPALSTKARRAMEPTRRRADVGFRCARDGQ
jgi:formylglycine-generating enzyme required for sulfatase activity